MAKQTISILLMLCIGLGFFQGCSDKKKTMTKEQLDQILKNDLPIGVPEKEVEAYLTNKNIEFSEYKENGVKIQAMIRDVKKDFLVSTSIHIVFSFDGNTKLTGFTTQNVFTGP